MHVEVGVIAPGHRVKPCGKRDFLELGLRSIKIPFSKTRDDISSLTNAY